MNARIPMLALPLLVACPKGDSGDAAGIVEGSIELDSSDVGEVTTHQVFGYEASGKGCQTGEW